MKSLLISCLCFVHFSIHIVGRFSLLMKMNLWDGKACRLYSNIGKCLKLDDSFDIGFFFFNYNKKL